MRVPILRSAAPYDREAAVSLVSRSLAAFGIAFDPEDKDADVLTFGWRGDGYDEIAADSDGELVGMVSLGPWHDFEAPAGWLSKLFVDERARGIGVGRVLLQAALDAGRGRGYRKIGLRTRAVFERATRLYELAGFVRRTDPEAGESGCDLFYVLDL